MAISFGGDATSFMQAPTMQNRDLGETMAAMSGGGSFFAQILDAVGIQRQVAKEPKAPKTDSKDGGASPVPIATPNAPRILTDISEALRPSDSETDRGSQWLNSIKPLMSIDPNQGFR